MKRSLIALALTGFGVALSGAAHAVNVDVNIGAPAPVVVAPAPVVVAPAPVVISTGWHGDRYWDGHRYWGRHDWEMRHRGPEPRRFCPPGHGMKGEC